MNRARARGAPVADEHDDGGFADTWPYFHDTMPFEYETGAPELEGQPLDTSVSGQGADPRCTCIAGLTPATCDTPASGVGPRADAGVAAPAGPPVSAAAMSPAGGMPRETSRARRPSAGLAAAPSAPARASPSRARSAGRPLRPAAGTREDATVRQGLSTLARLRPAAALAAIAVATIAAAGALVLHAERLGGLAASTPADAVRHAGSAGSQAAVPARLQGPAQVPAR